eukprot:scaffold117515_cov62-Phaeocystis_antarctica.AAC.2
MGGATSCRLTHARRNARLERGGCKRRRCRRAETRNGIVRRDAEQILCVVRRFRPWNPGFMYLAYFDTRHATRYPDTSWATKDSLWPGVARQRGGKRASLSTAGSDRCSREWSSPFSSACSANVRSKRTP